MHDPEALLDGASFDHGILVVVETIRTVPETGTVVSMFQYAPDDGSCPVRSTWKPVWGGQPLPLSTTAVSPAEVTLLKVNVTPPGESEPPSRSTVTFVPAGVEVHSSAPHGVDAGQGESVPLHASVGSNDAQRLGRV